MSDYMHVPGEKGSFTYDDLHKSLPSRIAEFIADGVFKGHYKPGDRLKEDELSKIFNTSRAPIREALYLLQINGLVDRLPRRGCVIRSYNQCQIEELYEVRIGLESMALERLFKNWNCSFQDSFKKILFKMEIAINDEDTLAYAHLNNQFHDLLCNLSGNETLYNLYKQLGHPIVPVLQSSMQHIESLQKSYLEHIEIIDALCNRQFDHAKKLLIANVQNGMKRAISLLND
ncbi:MAG: GntR family transcriptional regulator [Acidibacillus sp.]|nr:GntR family transcriptional regulator [Acidibacillus sp.]